MYTLYSSITWNLEKLLTRNFQDLLFMLKRSFTYCYMICMIVLKSPPLQPQTKIITEKSKWWLLYRTYAFAKSLNFLTCQIFLFESGEISLWNMNQTLEKYMQERKIESKNNFSQQYKINTIKICRNVDL